MYTIYNVTTNYKTLVSSATQDNAYDVLYLYFKPRIVDEISDISDVLVCRLNTSNNFTTKPEQP